MLFEEGTYINKNQLLFVINQDRYKARVDKAKAQLNKDMAQSRKAERDLERIRPLYEQNAASQLDLDNAKVGVSYTNMFPRIALTTDLGFETDKLSTMFSSPMFFIGANLLSPIFNFGKNKAKYKAQIAAYEQECYRYEKVVMSAFYEVMNALVEFDKIKSIYETRLLLEQSAKVTMDLAQLQYINGVIGYLDVLDAQRNYFDAQIGLSNAYRDKQITMVKLYKALGGGWK